MKKLKKRTAFTILSMCMLILYTSVVLILTACNKEVPDSLTYCWFPAWTAELALLYGLKVNESKGEHHGR